jgi:hypothetical protein
MAVDSEHTSLEDWATAVATLPTGVKHEVGVGCEGQAGA